MLGILCPRCPQLHQVTQNSTTASRCTFEFCIHVKLIVITAGTLISHEKLLLQINTERELGNMDYKLGQVRNVHQRVDYI